MHVKSVCIYFHCLNLNGFQPVFYSSLPEWQQDLRAADHRGVRPQTGHQAPDQRLAQPSVEGLGQRGGLHHDGLYLSHAHGPAPPHGAKSQVLRRKMGFGRKWWRIISRK